MPFEELGLSEPVLKAVKDAGYTEPTPIQARAIPHVLKGDDVLGCAQTGTGKTAGFTLPMIELLSRGRARARMPRSLILEPTRELAAQVAENFEVYGRYHRLNMALLIGGVSFDDQAKVIDRGADVLIATPGRLLDMFERGGLLLRGVEVLVIDEADRMLDMGFIPDVERIVQLCNPKRQTLFFSATMPPEIRRLADRFLKDPVEIEVAPPASPALTVDQSLVVLPSPSDKREALRQLLRSQPVKNALIFCNRKRDVDTVQRSLSKHGFDAAALHGDMSQSHRTQTLERFKNDELTILVCSDVAARGIDIQGLSHVFLFDVPTHSEDYVHRIGRTGRAGMPGRAFTLATPEDGRLLAGVEKLIGRPIPRFEMESFETTDVDADDDGRGRRRSGRRTGGSGSKPASRSRSRSRGEAKAEAPRQEEPAPAPTEAAPVDVPETARESAPQPEAEVQEAQEPRRAKKAEALRENNRRGAAREQAPREAKPRGRRRSRDDDDDRPVVGLGDHVPAFLLRPVRKPEPANDKDQDD